VGASNPISDASTRFFGLLMPLMTMTFKTALKIALLLLSVCLFGAPRAAQAQSIIRQPGNHANYSFEVEPHLAFQWTDRIGTDDGIGPGVRFNIPFMHNGPISRINNSMGITFGLDITFSDGGLGYCYRGYDPRLVDNDDCNVTEFWLPVAMQWNFYLTPVISVFGEPGFAIAHRRWSYQWFCQGNGGELCDRDFDDTDLEFVLWGGARFMFSDRIGATVRVGYPMVTAGINFLL
jgi:opacity protein-like surface antigen